jgi:TRAP-type C4-dicarboxylate transport system permease small subunit
MPAVLLALARACAVAGGLLMTALSAVLCISLAGRNTTGWTLVGDFELTAAACGAAIALCLPWCQVARGHVAVDFFTAGASAAVRGALDRLGAAALAALLGLLAWRAALGGMDAWRSQTTSMLMALPEWWVYAAMVPGLALAAVIAGWQAAFGFGPPAVARPVQPMPAGPR